MAAHSRLKTAIDDGLIELPDGDVVVVRPGRDFDFSPFGARPQHIVSTFRPDVDAWAEAGRTVAQHIPKAETILVVAQRSKDFTRSLIAEAAQKADLVIVDGQKVDGIDGIFKNCRKTLGKLPSVTKAHGRLFWFESTDVLNSWQIDGPTQDKNGYYTTAGVFSEGEIDKGSQLLLQWLPDTLPSRVADFGSGWGYLSAGILKRTGVETLDMLEAEHIAIDCAKLNVTDARASHVWADVTRFKTAEPYDAIIMNPPFHTGREGDPALGCDFIRTAARSLKGSGKLWMVANRHLPYEDTLSQCFQVVKPLQGSSGFKVFEASRPKR